MERFQSCVDETFWSSSSKFIVLPSEPLKKKDLQELCRFFESIKKLNAVILFSEIRNKNFITKMSSFNYLIKHAKVFPPSTNIDVVFPDKLRNLQPYKFKAIGAEQKPRMFRINDKVHGFDIFFLNIFLRQQNAISEIEYGDLTSYQFQETMIKNLVSGVIDLNLNTIYSGGSLPNMQKYFKSINTYDVNGYCALIPIPPRNSFLTYIFVPYDTASWILMVISLVALAIVWKLFKSQRDSRGLSSVGRVIFRVIAGFLGQAFNFVTTRWFQVMVMQVFIFMVLILGNAYQSILISLMTVSRNGTRITTVNEMMQGDYNYISDGFFYGVIEQYQQNTSMHKNLQDNIYIYVKDKVRYEQTAANNSVLIVKCDFANDLFYTKNNEFIHGNPSDFYYILPEKVIAIYETLTTGRFSPFTERLDEISLRIFESGIKQYWKTLLHKLTDSIDLEQISIMKEEFLLKMGDFKYVFYIWAIGVSVATIAFVAELLCYKHRARIRKTWVGKLMRRWSGTEKRRRREIMRIRRRARVVIEPFEEFEMIQC
jgi:hypothetical protein